METDEIVRQSMGFEVDTWPAGDANRLPNGNTLITAATKIVEVTLGVCPSNGWFAVGKRE